MPDHGIRGFLLVVGTTCVLASGLFHVLGFLVNTMGCNLRDIRKDEYLAACSQPVYQSYEHGALFYGVEPLSTEFMRAADVLFLGNSRAQAGWHDDALRTHLTEKSIAFYMLGFGFDEKMAFARALITKHNLRPKLLVINADPFFVGSLSPASRGILDVGADGWFFYAYRRLLYQTKHHFCATGFATATDRWCGGDRLTVLRRRQDGSWRVLNWYDGDVPLDQYSIARAPVSSVDPILRGAEKFVSELDLHPSCIIITAVPSPASSRELVRAIAARAGTAHAYPEITGLRTYDGQHLQATSAARWSAAFFQETEAIFKRCLQY